MKLYLEIVISIKIIPETVRKDEEKIKVNVACNVVIDYVYYNIFHLMNKVYGYDYGMYFLDVNDLHLNRMVVKVFKNFLD